MLSSSNMTSNIRTVAMFVINDLHQHLMYNVYVEMLITYLRFKFNMPSSSC
jgi:hypothetical protein